METVQPNTITVNGVDYVRADSVKENAPSISLVDGKPNGLYCIIRCMGAGVWAGYVKEHNQKSVVLQSGRRLYSWKAKQGITLSAVSQYGVTSSSIPAAVDVVFLEDVCEVIPCTSTAAKSIQNYDEAKQA